MMKLAKIAALAMVSAGVASMGGAGGAMAQTANPCAGKAANPCAPPNPCAPANPCAGAAAIKLTAKEAAAMYQRVGKDLQAGYAKSGDSAAKEYRGWQRYNTVPYLSETHGERYVNNYANKLAKDYGKFDPQMALPQGAVLAKDSFRALPGGKVEKGPLFVMEKMANGFNPDSGDWRYKMFMPDGALFGETKGKNGDQVSFCHECHAGAGAGHTFFMPEEYRAKGK